MSTEDLKKSNKECNEDSKKSNKECTVDSKESNKECTVDSKKSNKECTVDSKKSNKECKEDNLEEVSGGGMGGFFRDIGKKIKEGWDNLFHGGSSKQLKADVDKIEGPLLPKNGED